MYNAQPSYITIKHILFRSSARRLLDSFATTYHEAEKPDHIAIQVYNKGVHPRLLAKVHIQRLYKARHVMLLGYV
jgi:hypothetical protein